MRSALLVLLALPSVYALTCKSGTIDATGKEAITSVTCPKGEFCYKVRDSNPFLPITKKTTLGYKNGDDYGFQADINSNTEHAVVKSCGTVIADLCFVRMSAFIELHLICPETAKITNQIVIGLIQEIKKN